MGDPARFRRKDEDIIAPDEDRQKAQAVFIDALSGLFKKHTGGE